MAESEQDVRRWLAPASLARPRPRWLAPALAGSPPPR